MEVISRYCSTKIFREGEIVFREGENDEELYIVDSGEVVITKNLPDGESSELARFVQGDCFGELDLVSAWMPFDYTAYYELELGSPLYRRLLAFETLIDQQDLAEVKLATNRIEQSYSRHRKRRVNIDPGYLLYERFVLASGKNFSHRIYIGHQIYADLTLIFRKGAFETLPWTYPDYADQPIRSFLERVRKKYAVDLKKTN